MNRAVIKMPGASLGEPSLIATVTLEVTLCNDVYVPMSMCYAPMSMCYAPMSMVLRANVDGATRQCRWCYVPMLISLCANVDVTFTRDGLNYIQKYACAPAGHAHTRDQSEPSLAPHRQVCFSRASCRKSLRLLFCVSLHAAYLCVKS